GRVHWKRGAAVHDLLERQLRRRVLGVHQLVGAANGEHAVVEAVLRVDLDLGVRVQAGPVDVRLKLEAAVGDAPGVGGAFDTPAGVEHAGVGVPQPVDELQHRDEVRV